MRSQLQIRHTLMENHINELSTKYTNHLGDYAVEVANMIFKHHEMLSEKIGVTSSLSANPGLQDVSMSPTTSPPPTITPPEPSFMLKKTKNKTDANTNTIADDRPGTELHELKLPPTLDMQWPKGHSTLWELIYNEVGDYVEEVGSSLLTALGADVVSTDRRLAGTSERHFEMEVKWPNGGKHILDEVQNQVKEKVEKVEAKVDKLTQQMEQMEEKVDKLAQQMEEKVDKLAQHAEEMKGVMEKLLQKIG